MNIILNPRKEDWKLISTRPQFELEYLETSVKNILSRVKTAGDKALLEFTRQFDKVDLETLAVSENEITQAIESTPEELKQAIQVAASNIKKFHHTQQATPIKIETMPGVTCWRKDVAIERVGIYIPGGSAPLFSTVLMLAIPASIIGCNDIILCTPPDANGRVNSAILYAASITGITKVFKIGGAQAIGALAYGTESIPQVYKIFGPGNQFVTKAKQVVNQEGIAIDLPAGPSEVLVVADETATPSFVAADLLSQAEHGGDSQVVLVASNAEVLKSVEQEMENQLNQLPRKDIARKALQNSSAVIFDNLSLIPEFINAYAPEHLIINTSTPELLADKITNAGSVFLGNYSPEAVGDYASGTNHTLPTNGFARAYSGVSLESFTKKITFQQLTKDGIKNIGPSVEIMAAAENLDGHKTAVSLRLQSLD